MGDGPDFTVTVTANMDPTQGAVAEGSRPDVPAQADDWPHVRNWVRGMILQIRAALPPGWDIEVETLHETGAQRDITWDEVDAIAGRPAVLDVEAHDA